MLIEMILAICLIRSLESNNIFLRFGEKATFEGWLIKDFRVKELLQIEINQPLLLQNLSLYKELAELREKKFNLISDDIKNGPNGTSGLKTFEYLLIPRHYGNFTIPSVSYSYFNISTGRYEKLTTDEFHFNALKGNDQNTGVNVYGGVAKEDVKYLGKDIRFIKPDPGILRKSANIILTKHSFYSAYGFSFLAFLVILFMRREHIRRNSDLSQVRNRKAGKVALKRLQSASICLKDEQIDKFYEEILKAVWGYLSDKLSIPVSDLNRTNAISSLQEWGVDEEKINNLAKILDACEFARFAPSSSGTEAATIYEGTSQFIKSVENLTD